MTEGCHPITPVDSEKVWLPDKEREAKTVPAYARDPILRCCVGTLPWPLFLCGEAGAGKTCTVLVMIDCYGGIFTRFPQWCENVRDAESGNLRSTVSGYTISRDELWERWERTNFAVMDEIGLRDRATDFQGEVLLRAMDLREARPTVFISNRDLTGIHNSYDDRIASRLAGGTVVLMTGDMRVQRTDKR